MQVNGLNTQIAGVARQETRGGNSAPKSTAEEPKKVGEFFVTPFLKFDSEAATILFQIRNGETGDVERQFPAESVVNQYRTDRARENSEVAEELFQSSGPAEDGDSEAEVATPAPQTNSGSGTGSAERSEASQPGRPQGSSGTGEDNARVDVSA